MKKERNRKKGFAIFKKKEEKGKINNQNTSKKEPTTSNAHKLFQTT